MWLASCTKTWGGADAATWRRPEWDVTSLPRFAAGGSAYVKLIDDFDDINLVMQTWMCRPVVLLVCKKLNERLHKRISKFLHEMVPERTAKVVIFTDEPARFESHSYVPRQAAKASTLHWETTITRRHWTFSRVEIRATHAVQQQGRWRPWFFYFTAL